jgi:uncharacterized protein YndB with AHSA1/START domain
MSVMDTATSTRSIVVEGQFPYAPERVWRALTEARLIAEWLMPNDFQPDVGTRFTFKTKPMGDWDGVVHCQVLAAEPPRLLRYSWKGGSESNSKYGSTLDSVVTWTLTPIPGGGTHLKMEHAGFRSPQNDFAYDAMSPGWGRIVESIARVVAKA